MKKLIAAVALVLIALLLIIGVEHYFRPVPDVGEILRKRDYDWWHMLPPPPPGPPQPEMRQERAFDPSKGFTLIGKRPAEWRIEIETFGMPGDYGYRAVVRPDRLWITKAKWPKGKDIPLFDGPIAANEATKMFDACLRTLERFRFQDSSSTLCDGSNLSISISANSQTLSAVYYGMGFHEEAGTEVKAILNMISSHSGDKRIF
jgi:hypothetical protein